jgi:predicted AAA+ superfamily ATPase
MIFYRELEAELKEWKNNKSHKPLILRGARQVGKTTLVRKFAKHFDYFIELNLEKANDKLFFTFSDQVQDIMDNIFLSRNIYYEKDKTYLLFIDEIQQYPKAIQLLRYFYEDLPEIYIISAGSLLEFALGDIISFPVGRVQQMMLYPLNFEEFLLALNKKAIHNKWKSLDINEFVHYELESLFNQYILVGGMPEAVSVFIGSGFQLSAIKPIFESIWTSYLDDALKYGKNEKEIKVLQFVLQSAPFTLDRINFTKWGQNLYKSREISDAMHQLQKAKILYLIYPTTQTKLPVIPDYKKRPRIQFLDTGLLNFINNKTSSLIINHDLNDSYRGQIHNHVVIQELMSNAHSMLETFHFWVREESTANAEVDVVLPYKNLLIPVEIKAGAVGRLKSLHEYMNRTNHNIGVRLLHNKLSTETVTTNSNKIFTLYNLPIYLSSRIKDVIDLK